MSRPNKAERDHLDRVRDLGCAICGREANAHHMKSGGMGMKSSHYDTFALCPWHHQYGGPGSAIHAGRQTWEEIFGTEQHFVEMTQRKLGLLPEE